MISLLPSPLHPPNSPRVTPRYAPPRALPRARTHMSQTRADRQAGPRAGSDRYKLSLAWQLCTRCTAVPLFESADPPGWTVNSKHQNSWQQLQRGGIFCQYAPQRVVEIFRARSCLLLTHRLGGFAFQMHPSIMQILEAAPGCGLHIAWICLLQLLT